MSLLPPHLQTDPRMVALETVIREEFDRLREDLPRLAVTDIPNVDAALLPALAWQYHVTADEGLILAGTEEHQRDLISRSFDWHRRLGTPYAVRTALELAGWPGAVFVEGFGPLLLDGSWLLDGSNVLDGEERPFHFQVRFARDLATWQTPALTYVLQQRLRRTVEATKPARSWYLGMALDLNITEPVGPTDYAVVTESRYALLDGSRRLDGSWSLGPLSETTYPF